MKTGFAMLQRLFKSNLLQPLQLQTRTVNCENVISNQNNCQLILLECHEYNPIKTSLAKDAAMIIE